MSNPLTPDPRTVAYYQNLFFEHGHKPEAVGWTKGKDHLRYAALINSWVGHCDSVLDFGCGLGGLAEWLHTSQGRAASYRGVDVVPELIASCKAYFEDRPPNKRDHFPMTNIDRASFAHINSALDLDKEFDHIVLCGVFNFNAGDPKIHAEHIKQTLAALWPLAKKGLHVDFLAPDPDFKAPMLHYQSLHDLVNWLKPFTRRYTIDRTYLPFEFCVHMRKEDLVDPKSATFEA